MVLSIMHALTYVRRLCITVICVYMHTFVCMDSSLLVCHFLCSEDSVVHFCLQHVSSVVSVALYGQSFPGCAALPEQFCVSLLVSVSSLWLLGTLISKEKLALCFPWYLSTGFSLPDLKFLLGFYFSLDYEVSRCGSSCLFYLVLA